MGQIKERDYMFDTFRGLLMLSIPISHFTKMSGNLYSDLYLGGGFPQQSFGGFVYITINVFVMQAFMFLSGYFSKKPERARETAFNTFMWPYLVFTVVYFLVRYFFFGNSHLSFLTPPFALWFLFALFFYRFFLGDMLKLRALLPLTIAMFLIAGQVQEFGDFMALGRAFSYLPFFILGVYCSKERLAWIRQLKKKPILLTLLGVVLVGISVILVFYGPNVGWYLLRESVDNFRGMAWYEDTLLRIAIFFIASGWIIFMLNILPSKKGIIAYVGTNTMPIYIFHLTLRYVIKFYGVYMCTVCCFVVAWFGVLSLIHKKVQNTALYVGAIIVSIIGFYIMFKSGCLEPIYNLCPKNQILYYVEIYGSALLCGFSFITPFWLKLYDLFIDGPSRLSPLTRWLKGPNYKEDEK